MKVWLSRRGMVDEIEFVEALHVDGVVGLSSSSLFTAMEFVGHDSSLYFLWVENVLCSVGPHGNCMNRRTYSTYTSYIYSAITRFSWEVRLKFCHRLCVFTGLLMSPFWLREQLTLTSASSYAWGILTLRFAVTWCVKLCFMRLLQGHFVNSITWTVIIAFRGLQAHVANTL